VLPAERRIKRFLIYLIASIVVLVFVFPIFWVFLSSFKTHAQAIAIPPIWFVKPTLENFIEIFENEPFFRYLANSGIVAAGSGLLVMVLALPAGYALARFRMPAKDHILFFILSTRMFPGITIGIPFLLVFHTVHLIDSHFGLIIAHTTFNLPIAIWLLRTFIIQIPKDIDEAAAIDGYTSLQTIRRVILPLIAPALTATLFLVVIFSWNEFMFALMLAPRFAKTLPPATVGLLGFGSIHWAVISAAVTVMTIPLIAYFLAVQRGLVRGLALGAV
jgi:ABC-type glycerol-3-phosphate transport system permease component